MHFPTLSSLTSPRCTAILSSLAYVLRLDIARIECRHACVRRLLITKGQGVSWVAELSHCSADWVMVRDRLIEQEAMQQAMSVEAAHEPQPVALQRRGAGADPHPAFMSEFLPGRSHSANVWSEANSEYRRLKSSGGGSGTGL